MLHNMVREASLILKAIEKEGLQGGQGANNGGVRHRHIHDPGIQQEPRHVAHRHGYAPLRVARIRPPKVGA